MPIFIHFMAVVIKSKIGHQKQYREGGGGHNLISILFRILESNRMQRSERVGFVGEEFQ